MEAKTPKPNCELSVPDSEHLISSLIHASKRLKELGFVYSNGKITVIDFDEPEQNQAESDIIRL